MKKNYLLHITLIFLGTLLYFIANIQRVAVPGAIFDTLQQDLMTSPASITALAASFMYLYSISQFFIGIFISKYGGYRVLTVGSILFSLGCIIFPLSQSLLILYFSRGLVGLGSATFYLGIIHEMKKVISAKNFGLILSICLLIGYLGGIIANAPLVLCVNEIGWRQLFIIIGIIAIIITILFVILKLFIYSGPINKNVKFNFDLYKKVLSNPENIHLYIFGCLNYALYYILQTVIGKKFLEDFTQIPVMNAAIILSVMGAIYAFSGPILATFSKILYNRRTIFLKIAALNTFFSMIIITLCITFNIKMFFIIPTIFCALSFFACLSPLLIPLVYDISEEQEASISVSVMVSMFFLIVAILSNITGYILNIFEKTQISNGNLIYSNNAYSCIFFIMTILALISLYSCWQIKDTKLTRRFIQYKKYLDINQ